MKKYQILLFVSLFVLELNAQNFSKGFNFTLPPFDTTTQKFLPNFPKHNISEFVKSSSKGLFLYKEKPIRFWGVNLTTGACFPNKSQAPLIAARMRKMGINLVRFHHMDNPWTSENGSIFNQDGKTTSLNSKSLDKLHFFLSKLKEEGVFANINLHVSRTFTEGDGILYADSILEFGKAVTYFDGDLILLQKQYAKQLLSSINPYTGISIAEDPVMAMLEITNENTLYGFWKDDRLQPFSNNGGILSRHADTLDRKWNEFLFKKYITNDSLIKVWNPGANVSVVDLLTDGDFESGNINQNWSLELHQTAIGNMTISSENPFKGNYCAKIQVDQVTNTNWHIQFEQNGISIEKDSTYSISFYAKSDSPLVIYTSVIKNEDPWTWYGGSNFKLTSEWKKYTFSFKAIESNNNLTRLAFLLGENTGTFYFDEVTMSVSKEVGLEEEEDLSLKNIRRIRYSERLGYNPKRVADMAEFYLELQKDYYDDMSSYLKNELGVKIPITGSNAFGGAHEPYTHRSLDYIDDHAYWDHVHFPNEPWSNWDWTISNKSMLKEDFLGTIPRLFGGLQMNNKPFTISEYNHPQPNIYQVEMLPILTGYGSFHGADGFMFFEYNGGGQANWTTDIQNNFFGTHRNTPVMSMFPIFSYAFQNGLIKEDKNPILIEYSKDYMLNMSQHDDHHRWHKYFPYDNRIALTNIIKISGFDFSETKIPSQTINQTLFKTSTGEVIFSSEHDLITIQTPKFESIGGFLKNAELFAGKQMQIKKGEKHGVIAWLSLTEAPLKLSKKSILALSSRFQNQNMKWNDENTTVNNNWGDSPTEVQPLNIEILLNIIADSIQVYPLDQIGQTIDSFIVYPKFDNQFLVNFNQDELHSLWFGISPFEKSNKLVEEQKFENISISPNPVKINGIITIDGIEIDTKYKIMDIGGKIISSGIYSKSIEIKNLVSGTYLILLTNKNKSYTKKLVVE